MTMTNRQWKAMLARNGVAAPKPARAKRIERLSDEIRFNEFARMYRMQDEMNADISREMGGYYGSNEDL